MPSVGSSALEGLRVLEISASGNWAASLLGMLLADQGASVAKVGVHSEHAPIEEAAARARSREARSRPGIDRNTRARPIASASDIGQFVAYADVVILSYDTGLSELAPATIRAQHPSVLVVTMCAFDSLENHPPDDGRCGAATGLFNDMNLYDRLFEPGKTKYTATPLPSAYAAMHAASATCLALGRRASTGRGDHIRVSLAGAFFQAQTAHLVNGFPGNEPVPAWLRWIPQLFFRDWLERKFVDKKFVVWVRNFDCADGPSKLRGAQLLTETQAGPAPRHGSLGRGGSRRRHPRQRFRSTGEPGDPQEPEDPGSHGAGVRQAELRVLGGASNARHSGNRLPHHRRVARTTLRS